MKIAEYQQMMDYLTGPRERFNGGGSVRNKTVLPKKKPEEEVKKRKIKNFEKVKGALENPKEVKEMIDKPKRGLVDEPGSYAGKEKYKNPKRALRRKNLYIKTYGQQSFDNLSRGDKSKVTSGDRNPLNVGQGKFKSFDPKFEPYRKEALKVFEKFKKSKKPFAPIDIAEKTIENMKGKKGAIKNINVAQFTQNLTRSFFTDEQRELFNIKEANIKRIIEKQTPKQTIFEEMIKGNSNIKSLMQATNLSKKEVERIVKNITTTDIPKARKELALGKDIQNVVLRNFTAKDFGTFRAALANEPTLNITFRKAIEELVSDAYKDQPKKLKRALTRLESYFSVAKKLREAGYPINLDHPLARSVIEDMGKVEPEQLIKVTPIPENINVGIKNNLFDRTYRQVINDLKARNLSTEDRKKLLIQKKSLENLQKDLNLGDMRMTSTGKIGKYGATGPLEKDFVKELKGVANFQNKFKSALENFEPQVLKEKIMGAFDVKDSRANQIINTLTNAVQETNPQKYLQILKGVLKGKKGILEGLKADASGALDTLSQAIFPTLQAAEVLPGEAKAAIPKPKKPMDFDLDMSLSKPSEPFKYLPDYSDAALVGAGTVAASKFTKPDPFKKVRRFPKKVGSGILRGATAVEAPMLALPQSAFQAGKLIGDIKKGKQTSVGAADITLPTSFSSLAASKKFGLDLFADNAGRIKRFLTAGLSPRAVSLLSRGSVYATPFLETGIQGYNAYKALKEADKKASVFEPRVDTALGKAPISYYNKIMSEIPSEGRSNEFSIPFTDKKFTLSEAGVGEFSAAGGGIAKLAGKSSGPAPESGPTPQGLDFLMKRGRQY